MKPILHSLLFALVWLASPACAQTVADTPEAVAGAMYSRMQAGDMVGAAELFDPAALKDLRGMLAPVIESLPKEESSAPAIRVLIGDASPETLKSASDAEFFAAILGGVIGRSGAELKSQEIIGSVPEGPELRHVVTRNTASAMGMTFTKMEVVSLHRVDGAWKVMLSGEMKGLAEAVRRRAGGSREQAGPGTGAAVEEPATGPATEPTGG